MADQGFRPRDENQRQTAGATTAKTDDRPAPGAERGDRERSIATGRDTSQSTGVGRRTAGAPALGFGPFSLMRRMTEDMDRLFANFALGRGLGLGSRLASDVDRDVWSGSGAEATWVPQLETFRRGDKLIVRADLPGMKKEDVTAEVSEGVLTICGERSDEHEDTRDDFFRSERSYGQFYRAIPLPEGVTGDQCEATFKDGVLEVSIPAPKQPERKARQIQIR
jgi:HSP20 family protein